MRPPNLSISPAGTTGNGCAMQARLAERGVRLLLVLGVSRMPSHAHLPW